MPRKRITIGVYLIRNTATGMVYVGSGAGRFGIEGRWDMHRVELRRNKHANPRLQASWNAHGESVFEFSIIETVLFREYVIEREQYWLDYYRNSGADMYNILPVAGSRLGIAVSEAAKQKASATLKGRSVTPETIAKRCIARDAIYSFVSPDGSEHRDIVNLKAFAVVRGLNSNTLRLVWTGVYHHHKGWVRLGTSIVWYTVTHRNGETARLHKGQLQSFCIEHSIDISNLLKVLKGKLRYANNWTIRID